MIESSPDATFGAAVQVSGPSRWVRCAYRLLRKLGAVSDAELDGTLELLREMLAT
jgi:hypothetical protein